MSGSGNWTGRERERDVVIDVLRSLWIVQGCVYVEFFEQEQAKKRMMDEERRRREDQEGAYEVRRVLDMRKVFVSKWSFYFLTLYIRTKYGMYYSVYRTSLHFSLGWSSRVLHPLGRPRPGRRQLGAGGESRLPGSHRQVYGQVGGREERGPQEPEGGPRQGPAPGVRLQQEGEEEARRFQVGRGALLSWTPLGVCRSPYVYNTCIYVLCRISYAGMDED